MAVAVVLALFFIVFTGVQKGQKWSWWCSLIVGLIVWGYGVYIQTSEGDWLNMILLLVGVLLPIRSFFGKKT
jgi:hypothetical protein